MAGWGRAGQTVGRGHRPDCGQVWRGVPTPAYTPFLCVMVRGSEESGDLLSLAIDCLARIYRDSLQSRIEARRVDLRAAEQDAGAPAQDILKEVIAMRQSLTDLSHRFDKYRA